MLHGSDGLNKCDGCSLRFRRLRELVTHLKTADQHLMRRCMICKKLLVCEQLIGHMKKHNQSKGEYPYGCSACLDVAMKESGSFCEHMLGHHVKMTTITRKEINRKL